MKRLLSTFATVAIVGSWIPSSVMAMECYVDPVIEYAGSGRIKSAVFMRSEACTSGTVVLKTLSSGSSVQVVGFTDGWYEVIGGGKRGWIGAQFLESSAQPTGTRWSNYEEYQMNRPTEVPVTPPVTPTPSTTETVFTGDVAPRMLVKLACPSVASSDHPCKAVYYIGADGKRHAFPNSRAFFTWYQNFDGVKALTGERLGQYMLGMNATYRPGVKMVKFTTDPKVYVVSRGGVLRWITSEALAVAYYGATWNKNVDDIADAFYTNYTFGADIVSESDYSPTGESASAPTLD